MNASDPLTDEERAELLKLREVVTHMHETWDASRKEAMIDVIKELDVLLDDSEGIDYEVILHCIEIVQQMK